MDGRTDTDGIQRQDTDQCQGETVAVHLSVTAVANGYGDNGAAATTENDFNYGSKTRIVTSSGSVPSASQVGA